MKRMGNRKNSSLWPFPLFQFPSTVPTIFHTSRHVRKPPVQWKFTWHCTSKYQAVYILTSYIRYLKNCNKMSNFSFSILPVSIAHRLFIPVLPLSVSLFALFNWHFAYQADTEMAPLAHWLVQVHLSRDCQVIITLPVLTFTALTSSFLPRWWENACRNINAMFRKKPSAEFWFLNLETETYQIRETEQPLVG